MTQLRRFSTTLLLLCLLRPAVAQPRQYTFTHFTTANGLPSNLINAIVQDEEGFLWFGTINGLSRYDGYHFQNFKNPRNSSFTFDDIANLFYDRHHDIWVVTRDSKIGRLNPRDFTFREYDTRLLAKPAFLQITFVEMPDGTLLAQEFYGRTFRLDETGGRFVLDSTTIARPPNWRIGRLVWDAFDKKYWMCADSGLAVFDPANRQLSYRGHNVEHNPIIDYYEAYRNANYITMDRDGDLIFYTWQPTESHPWVHVVNRKTGEKLKLDLGVLFNMGYHEPGEVMQQRNGRLWLSGAPYMGEWLPDHKSAIPVVNDFRTDQSIHFDNVRTMFEDGERNVWVATDNGLYMFNPDAQLFNNYSFLLSGDNQLHDFSATSALQLKDSTLFVGTWGPGLFVFDKNFKQIPLPHALDVAMTHNRSVWDLLLHTKTGKVWLTLQHGDIVVYDPVVQAARLYSPAAFNHHTVRQITEDLDGNLWYGLQNGAIVKWDFQESGGNPAVGYTEVTRTGRILKMITGSDGYIWAGTFAHGLVKIDPAENKVVQTFVHDSADDGLTADIVTDVLQYNDSLVIAVANSLNIINTRTGKVRAITEREGLPSNTAQCIELDRFGNLWVGMLNGLCRINLQKGVSVIYNRSNGIAYDNFMPAGAHQLPDGRLVFTTEHNFMVFDPKHFSSGSEVPPDPDFSSFTLSGKRLSVDSLLSLGKVVLPYDNSSIGVAFSVLSFLKQKQPDYYYTLEGFDKGWIQTNGTNEAVYSYLPPGHYLFKVKAINQDGVFSKGLAELAIVVEPPFWRAWWFYGLVALFAVTMLYLIDKERQKRSRALQAVRTQIAGDLHEEINVTLNDINLLSEIAKIKADKDIDRSKDYIDQISTKSRTMIESMDDILWSIHPENDSMQRMLLRIYEFTDGVKKTHNLDVELTVDQEVERLVLDMKTRHEFMLFYKDALVYVIQHSVCDTVYISLEYMKGKLALKMLAQCSQIDNPAGQTAQLEYQMQRRADALDGMLDIMSDRKSISIILQVTA